MVLPGYQGQLGRAPICHHVLLGVLSFSLTSPPTFSLIFFADACCNQRFDIEHDIFILTDNIADDLKELRHHLFVSACAYVESTIERFTKTVESYVMMEHSICNNCGMQKPLASKKCSPCGGRELVHDQCTLPKRLVYMFDWLRYAGLWPMTGCDSETIGQSFTEWVIDCSKVQGHVCSGGQICPSSKEAQTQLIDGIRSTTKCTGGLSLSEYISID